MPWLGAGRARLGVVLIAVAIIGAYCWISADLRPFTLPIGVAVAVPSLIVAVYTWRRADTLLPTTANQGAARWRGAAPWGVLFGALVAVELVSYVSSPRRDHPTLSSISDSAMGTHPGRAIVFALWLLLGWALLLRRGAGER